MIHGNIFANKLVFQLYCMFFLSGIWHRMATTGCQQNLISAFSVQYSISVEKTNKYIMQTVPHCTIQNAKLDSPGESPVQTH